MLLETVPAEMLSSWATTLALTRQSWNFMSHFLAHFLWRWFHWPTCKWIIYNRFPIPLNLLGPKPYLVVGRINITIYSIHPFVDLFSLLPFLCEKFYHGTKLQIPRVHCRLARHCTSHSPIARLICKCCCYMLRLVPTCLCKVTSGVMM